MKNFSILTALFLFFMAVTPLSGNTQPAALFPIPMSPAANAVNVPTNPLLQWSALSGTKFYELEVRDTLGTKIFSREDIASTSFVIPPGLLAYTTPYFWRVRARNAAGVSDWSSTSSFFTQSVTGDPYAAQPDDQADDDEDGIPNNEEKEILQTDPLKKTLFVRPKKEIGFVDFNYVYEYWKEFIYLFPFPQDSEDPPPGRAYIEPFALAVTISSAGKEIQGIEVVVIGDPDNPYKDMQNFEYEPADDSNNPHCDIMEIILVREKNTEGEGLYPGAHHYRSGHTFFADQMPTIIDGQPTYAAAWSWDTKGYTPKSPIKFDYFIPKIYPFPINNYFKEGAYQNLSDGEKPVSGVSDCDTVNCIHKSPMNLSGQPPGYGLPDGTVEFNDITFDIPSRAINSVGQQGKEYSIEEVMKRTIVHEMGHALLAADNGDHCANPQCIMYEYSHDWNLYCFGSPCIPNGGQTAGQCGHMPDGFQDIRAKYVIHNKTH